MLKQIVVAVMFVILFAGLAAADNAVSGRIDQDCVWSGRLTVSGDVTVTAGATLTVKPGSHIEFSNGVRLSVHGRILAGGTKDQPITLLAQAEVAAAAWHGIVLSPRPNAERGRPRGSRFSHCRIRGAVRAISVTAEAASPHRLKACQITQCQLVGIQVRSARDVVVDGCHISKCGSVEQRPSGAIVVTQSRHCRVLDNVIENCAGYGVQLEQSSDNTVRGNTVTSIRGRHRKPDGMGIALHEANRNLVLSNKVSGMNYMCLYVGDSADNLIIDNELRNSPDGLGMTGPKATRNIIRDNRIYGSWWGQIYFTNRAHDNLVQDMTVSGGDAGITQWYAGPNTFQDCEFLGCGPIAFKGGVKAIFRRCTMQLGRGNEDLWTEFEPDCTLIDCNIRKDHIGFSKGTTKKSQIIFKRTFTVNVVNADTGKPVVGATLTANSDGDQSLTQSTDKKGGARFELLEGVVRKGDGWREAGDYSLSVKAKGFRSVQPVSINVTGAVTSLLISLTRLANE
ncbi:MAG: right-handed parallel beta-helix repeat-containing protein [Planctomycetota bacterium]|nr:right-handed parallel beta-helix repeat-containing protein [Planctomycetota bacterium]